MFGADGEIEIVAVGVALRTTTDIGSADEPATELSPGVNTVAVAVAPAAVTCTEPTVALVSSVKVTVPAGRVPEAGVTVAEREIVLPTTTGVEAEITVLVDTALVMVPVAVVAFQASVVWYVPVTTVPLPFWQVAVTT